MRTLKLLSDLCAISFPFLFHPSSFFPLVFEKGGWFFQPPFFTKEYIPIVFRPEHTGPGAQHLAFEYRPQKFFQRHPVVGKKSGQRQRRGPKNTYPARRFRSKRIHTSKIHPHRCSHSGKRASELPQRQPEKNAFMVLPYFLRHLYLQNSFTSLQAHHFPHDAVRAFYQSHKDQHVEDHFRHIGPNHRNR